jgi:hypothetical protein
MTKRFQLLEATLAKVDVTQEVPSHHAHKTHVN